MGTDLDTPRRRSDSAQVAGNLYGPSECVRPSLFVTIVGCIVKPDAAFKSSPRCVRELERQ